MTLDNYQTDVKNLQGNLLSYALILTSDRDKAYDLLGETTAAMIDHERTFSSSDSVKELAMKVMKFIYRKHYTRTVRVRQESCYRIDVAEPAADYRGVAVEESRLTAAIKGLDRESREVCELYVAGFTASEVSHRCGIKLGRVFDCMRRATAMLRCACL